MNPDLSHLHRYPFEKRAQLKSGCMPPENLTPISLSIGEPKHPAPDFALLSMINNLSCVATYPLTKGTRSLHQAIARWLIQRFNLKNNHIDPENNILAVNGTRKALFAITQTLIDPNVTVLPGKYRSRDSNRLNPCANRIRLARWSPNSNNVGMPRKEFASLLKILRHNVPIHVKIGSINRNQI